MKLTATFKDGSEGAVTICGASGDYVDGLPHSFLVGIATRGDGFKRVLFLTPDGREEQADPWIKAITRHTLAVA